MSKLGDEPAYPAKQFSCPECKGYGCKSQKFCPKCNGCGLVINERNSGFTKRERACIDLRIPESGNAELDALIVKAQRRDMAAVMLAARAEHEADDTYDPVWARQAYRSADALLAELAKETAQ